MAVKKTRVDSSGDSADAGTETDETATAAGAGADPLVLDLRKAPAQFDPPVLDLRKAPAQFDPLVLDQDVPKGNASEPNGTVSVHDSAGNVSVPASVPVAAPTESVSDPVPAPPVPTLSIKAPVQPRRPGLLDQVLAYPKAELQGAIEGFNGNALGRTISDPGYGLQESQHPTLGAIGHSLGALAGGVQTFALRPDIALQRAVSGGAPAASADAKLGIQPHTSSNLGPLPPAHNEQGSILDTLQSLIYPRQVPMEHMETEGIKSGTQQMVSGLQQNAEEDLAANKETQPVLEQLAKGQTDITKRGDEQMQASLRDQRDYSQKTASATLRAEQIADQMGPEHYWAHQDTAQKIWNVASLMLSGIGSGLSGQPNLAAQRIQQEIQQDTQAQLEQIKSRQNTASTMHGLAGIAHETFGDAAQAATWLTGQKTNEAVAFLRYIGAKYPKIQGTLNQTIGKLISDQTVLENVQREKENRARVESRQAAAQERGANGAMLQQALEAKKLEDEIAARKVDLGNGQSYTANSRPAAEKIQAAVQENDAEMAAIRNAKKVAAGTHVYSGQTQIKDFLAALAPVISHLPAAEQEFVKEAAKPDGLGRFTDLTSVLEQLEQSARARRKAFIPGGGSGAAADPGLSQ